LEDRRLLSAVSLGLSYPGPVNSAQIDQSYGQLPLSFEMNQGQTDPQVQFLSHGSGYGLFLTPTEAVLSLETSGVSQSSAVLSPLASASQPAKPDVIQMTLVGANGSGQGVGVNPQATKTNYFIGNDPTKWRTNIPNYGQVEYDNVYPGVNLLYYGNQRQLEYDFDVAPGADPNLITLRFQGQDSLALDSQGDLVIHTAGGDVVEHAPVLYQEVAGVRQMVSGQYALTGTDQVGFAVGAYDASKPLTIDPILSYSTYLGGSDLDIGNGIAVDSSGNAYVAGATGSTDFPITAGGLQTTYGGGYNDVFVAKLNASGTSLVYSTYLGGNGNDGNEGVNVIALDSSGDAYLTGHTESTNFPTTPGAFQTTIGAFPSAFVAKLNASGNALVYSTYLGGAAGEYSTGTAGRSIALDAAGNAYVTIDTSSPTMPTTAGAFQPTYGGGSNNAYLAKLNPSGTALVYATYLGGNTFDATGGMAVDSSGNVYVTGYTRSTNFPITPGAFQTTFGGGSYDAFVTKLNANGTALLYSTYLGGSGTDLGIDVAVDSSGDAYVTGWADSINFPLTSGAFQTTLGGSQNVFVTKLNATGSALVYSTYLGGRGPDYGYEIAVDSSGNAYVAGYTSSTNFPTTLDAFQSTYSGGDDAFVSILNATGTALVYSTYLGGNGFDQVRGIALDGSGNAYVTGATTSTDFPTTTGVFQTTSGGGYDAFITKIAITTDISATGTTATGTEGVLASFLVATFTDPNANDGLVDLSATVDWGDGSETGGTVLAVASGGFAVVGPHNYTEEGSYDVTVNISDIGGSTASADSTVNVADAPLTASSTTLTSKEGMPFNGQVASVTDGNFSSDVGDLSATINWGDGSATLTETLNFSTLSPTGVTYTVAGNHTYAEEGSYQVAVTIADQGGSSTTTTTTMTVAVVPPTATIAGPADGVPGQPRTFTFAAADISPIDRAAGFIYTINWGDGTPVQTIPRTPGNGSGISIDHVYAAPGSYTVQATATEDGGSNGTVSHSVVIKSAEMQGNTLAVGGGLGSSTIVLVPADTLGDISVRLNTVSQGTFLPTDYTPRGHE